MKKHFTLLLVCYFFVPVLPAHAVVVNLSPQAVEEAIAFGNTNRSSIEKDLDGSYAFGSTDEYAEGGVVHTKWYKLAIHVRAKSTSGRNVIRTGAGGNSIRSVPPD